MEMKVVSLNIRGVTGKERFLVNLATKLQLDFMFLQETYIDNERKFIELIEKLGITSGAYSAGVSGAKGVCTLQFSDRHEIMNTNRDTEGRCVIVRVKSRDGKKKTTLINTYAPCNKQEQRDFVKHIHYKLEHFHKDEKMIWGGDFNVDYRENSIEARSLLETTQCFKLQNTAESLKQSEPHHTFKYLDNRAQTLRNLDRFYIHEAYNTFQIHHTEVHKYSDHLAVVLELGREQEEGKKRKAAYWKLNNTQLKRDRDREAIARILNIGREEIDKCPERAIEIWTTTKHLIMRVSQELAIRESKKKRDRAKEILALLETPALEKERKVMLQKELDDIEEEKYKGAAIRCKVDTEQEDILTKHFLAREQNIQKDRTIKEIQKRNGEVTNNREEIKKEFQEFYKHLYTEEGLGTEEQQDKYLKYVKKIDEEDREKMENPFTENEITTAIKELNKGKSPGPDGLTNEFYQEYQGQLVPILKKVVDQAIERGNLPKEMKLSYITLLPKDLANRTEVSKYRPVSLLNADYKIISKILTSRLQPVMHKLVHEDQQCAVKGRKIQNHLHNIREIITYCRIKNIPARILSLDQEKAFDRVSHSFLHKVLEASNISQYVGDWIKILYDDPCSRVIVNQELSEEFTLTRSVRQGCSMSPLLYTLILEPLLENIRQDKEIGGIKLPGGREQKCKAFADDTIMLTMKDNSITKIIKRFEEYGKASGNKINIAKTSIMNIGLDNNRQNPPLNLKVVKEIKIYGLHFTNSQKQTTTKWWENILVKCQNQVNTYENKPTTIFGRVRIINSKIVPQTLYQLNIFSPPTDFFKEYRKIIWPFLYKNTLRRISLRELTMDYGEGGLQLQDLETKTKAMRIKHVAEAIDNIDKFPLVEYFLGIDLVRLTPLNNGKPHCFQRINSPFHQDIRKVINNHSEQVKIKKPYKEIRPRPTKPLYEKMKLMYRYKIEEVEEAFRNLHRSGLTNRTKEITYRLLYNITPIPPGAKCAFCKEQQTEAHMYGLCIVWRGARLELQRKIREMSIIVEWDILQILLINIFPNFGQATSQIIELVHKYRRLVWELTLKQMYHEA